MRLGFTFLFSVLLAFALSAQINAGSFIPVTVSITTPADIAGQVPYGTSVAAWGGSVSENFSGEVVWGFNATDSLGCAAQGPLVTDLTGKIGMIRRGVCNFTEKAQAAEAAGAIAMIVVNDFRNGPTDTGVQGMGGAADDITIPCIFLSAATSVLIDGALQAGEVVTLSYEVGNFYNPSTSWIYNQPLAEYQSYSMSVGFYNPSMDEQIVELTATVTAPSGAEESVMLIDTFAGTTADTVSFPDFYNPSEIGLHTVTFTSNVSADDLVSDFNVTEFTYNSAQFTDYADGIALAPSDDLYLNAGIYQAASLVFTDSLEGTLATYASFGLANPEAFFDETDGGDVFSIVLYDADADNDGAVDLVNGFDDMNNGVIAAAEYTITGMETPGEQLFVMFEEPVELEDNEIYYISVAKTPDEGTGITPQFIGSSDNITYYNFFDGNGGVIYASPLQLDQLYSGFNGATVSVDLHLDGFMLPSDVRDLPFLAADQVQIAPNPVASQLNLTLKLEGVVNNVQVGIAGVDGRRHGLYNFDAVTEAPLTINVDALPAGTYFLSILTDQGYRTEKFVKQ